MNEKRFYYGIFDDGTEYIEDYCKNKYYFNLDDVEELLNEQQVTIDKLEQINKESNDCEFVLCQDDLGNYEIRYDDRIFHFLWEVAPILNEQQATINKQEQKIRILQQEINDTQAILEMLTEKLKGWK